MENCMIGRNVQEWGRQALGKAGLRSFVAKCVDVADVVVGLAVLLHWVLSY